MKKRTIWITITSVLAVILVLAVAGMVYAAHYASAISTNEKHTAAGAIRLAHAVLEKVPTDFAPGNQLYSDIIE